MPFFINQCSLQFNLHDSEFQLFRKIIFSAIVFELLVVIVLRIMSGMKNYDLQMIRKQLEEKKKIEENAIFQIMENLNLNELSQQNHTIATIINSTTSQIKILKKDSININPIDTMVLNKPEKNKKDKPIEQENAENQTEESNSSDESQATDQNDQENNQTASDSVDEVQMLIKEHNNYINVLNIKLNRSQASTFFNVVIGNFLIAAALSLEHSPSIASAIFVILHALLFALLLAVNACCSGSSNQVGYTVNQDTLKMQHQRNPSEGTMVQKKTQERHNERPKELNLKRKTSLLIMALMLLINLCLLTNSVTQIKQSYFNPKENRCQ